MHIPQALLSLLLTLLTPSPTSAETLAATNASLLWGPYRPNLYFGLRPRVPDSLLMGLMWGKLADGAEKLRHSCEQSHGMAGYGWTSYDARRGGVQDIRDVGNAVDVSMRFVKSYQGQSAGNWGVRVKGTPREDADPDVQMSVVVYVGMERMEDCQGCGLAATVEERGYGDDRVVEDVELLVSHPDLGGAVLRIPKPRAVVNGKVVRNSTESGHVEMSVKSVNVTGDRVWQAKSLFTDILNDTRSDRWTDKFISNEPDIGNMQFVQLVFKGQFEFDILYSSKDATRQMTSSDLSREAEDNIDSFNSKFSSVFPAQQPFTNDTYVDFARHLFANLLGGLGYFHGETLVDDSHPTEFDESEPRFWEKAAEARGRSEAKTKGPDELFTHVPSRPFFPRGFLWDEGFHLLPISDWDIDLAIEVVRSWLFLMDADGWIAREQILGAEARSKVPKDFQIQYPHIANPPTLFWIVDRFLEMRQGKTSYFGHHSIYLSQPEMGKDLLEELTPLLERHYKWFRKTQSGDVEAHSIPQASLNEGYRWRGRTPGYTFASGLDDYPRAEPPDPSELHLDALCWVGVMASVLQKLAAELQNLSASSLYLTQHQDIAHNLEVLHWSPAASTYCDTRIWDDVHSFTCPRGYLSLFPLITCFLHPHHAHLNDTLNLIADPRHIWTPFGLRSLSPESTHYGTGDNYWRGPIWINVNYLVIKQLLDLAIQDGPLRDRCREIYTQLRRNVVQTVYDEWRATGFAWEQYKQATGKGQRTQHFTGWTALVAKIVAIPDLREREDADWGDMVGKTIGSLVKDARRDWVGSMGILVGWLMLGGSLYLMRRRFKRLFIGLWRKRR